MRYAIIKNGIVDNIIIAKKKLIKDMVLLNDEDIVCIGYSYDKATNTFIPYEEKEVEAT